MGGMRLVREIIDARAPLPHGQPRATRGCGGATPSARTGGEYRIYVAAVADRHGLGRRLRGRGIGTTEVDSQRWRLRIACERLRGLAPSTVEQSHGCADSLARIGERGDEGAMASGVSSLTNLWRRDEPPFYCRNVVMTSRAL